MKHAYELLISSHHKGDLAVTTILEELRQFVTALRPLSLTLTDWLLGGETKEEALLYEVFDGDKPTSIVRNILEEKLKGKVDPRCIGIWNGRERHEGASVSFYGRPTAEVSLISFVGRPKSFSPDWRAITNVVTAGASIWTPDYISLESNGYTEHKVFKDRPAVGWMLYLPRVLTVQQVPEARALVPVMGKDKNGQDQQLGTIIVSVTDEPFSDENPEHVKIANAIEIRLVDQDLLPRYADL